MGLSRFFKRKAAGDAPANGARTAPTFDAVERVRTRTRQRLIGAVVLLTIGVIGFPLVFESQPRPIPVDIPIEIPRPETAPALVLPIQRREAAPAPTEMSASRASEGAGTPIAGASRELPSEPMSASEPSASPAPMTPSGAGSAGAGGKVAVAPARQQASSAQDMPAAVTVAKPVPDAGRARLAASTAPGSSSPVPASSAEGSARFVVQVGAFADPAAARELRVKMEKLGLKTYTQVAETSAGKRIRVRLGPFATRAEADKAQARSKDAGIAAVVLTL
jgi:DedD protein